MADKDTKKLVKALRAQGWRVELHKGHYKAFAPGGKGIVTISSTPSDRRDMKNTMSHLKRLGYREGR